MKATSFKCQDKEKMSAAAGIHNPLSSIPNFVQFSVV